jgi:hypothetical protein
MRDEEHTFTNAFIAQWGEVEKMAVDISDN